MSSVRREPAGTGVTGETGACDGVDDWRLAQQTVESCSVARPVLQHRERKPQQAPATLLRRMLIVTPHPHVHRSAHLLCQEARLSPKGTVTSLSLTHVSLTSSETSVSSS